MTACTAHGRESCASCHAERQLRRRVRLQKIENQLKANRAQQRDLAIEQIQLIEERRQLTAALFET